MAVAARADSRWLYGPAPDLLLGCGGLYAGVFLALAAQWQHIGGGDFQIGRGAHLTHGDRHAVQVGVVDISARQNFGQGAADQFADTQLPLGRAGAIVEFVLCHVLDLSPNPTFAKRPRTG